MEWISNGIGLFSTVFGIVGLLGGAAGYFKASRGDSIIKYQTIELNLREEKITSLEKEKLAAEAEKKAADAACIVKDQSIAEKDQQIAFLQKMSQGSPELKKLTQAVKNQTNVINKLLKKEV